MLQAHPNIKAVYASNDMMAAGARLAAKGAGKKDGDIKILGTDGLPGPAGGIRAVANGEWAATFTYPIGAPEAIEMAKSILVDCAESVPTTVTVATTAITPDNAKQMMGN
jgi:ribose transport system substrate-binding protein